MAHPVVSALPAIVLGFGMMMPAMDVAAESASDLPANCLDAPFTTAATESQARIRAIAAGLKPALLDFPSLRSVLEADGMRICLSTDLVTERAYYDVETGRIVLAASMPQDLSRLVLVHELRHAEQLSRGICPSQSLAMKDYARGVLALEADANVVAALVAWNWKAEGNDALWRALESWPMVADIAARFQNVLTESGDVASAASAAFEQWYTSEKRVELYYVNTCSHYLDRQDEAHALPGKLQLAGDYLQHLCILPDGRGYDCVDAIRE